MGYSPVAIPSIVPQYTTEGQDTTLIGASAYSGSIVLGKGWQTTVAAASNGVSLTTLAGGTALSVAAIGGPLSANYFAHGTQTILVETSSGLAPLTYTGTTGTPGSAGTYTGIALGTLALFPGATNGTSTITFSPLAVGPSLNNPGVLVGMTVTGAGITGSAQVTAVNYSTGVVTITGTITTLTTVANYVFSPGGTWTVATGNQVLAQSLTIPDVYAGASLVRGVGGVPGTSDWPSLVSNIENNLTGLPLQGIGLVFPVYNDTGLAPFALQWATNSGTGVSTVTTGSPSVTPNSGAGGALASSVLLGSTGAVAGDNRSFRRLMLFFQRQATGATVTIATTGVVVSSGAISTAGSGLAVWDSGDLGYTAAGTGFTATAGTVSGGTAGGVVLVAALYIQSSGQNGSINVNISKGGTETGDWATTLTGMEAFLSLLVQMGMTPRQYILGDQATVDLFNAAAGAPGTSTTNLETIITAVQATSPLTAVIVLGTYNAGGSGSTLVSNSIWANTWIPAIRAAAVAQDASFLDGYARFSGVNANTGDAYGLTIDNTHFGTPLPNAFNVGSKSNINGQQDIAAWFVEKLNYSKNFAVSGVIQSQTATDGKVVSLLSTGTSGVPLGAVEQVFVNENDANPSVEIGVIISQLASGIATGPGGSAALDTFLTRAAANAWTTGSTGQIQAGSFIANNFQRRVTTSTSNSLTVPTSTGILNWTPTTTATCTFTTSGVTDGQMIELRIYASQTVTYTNTENSVVAAPTSTTGSATLPQSSLFQFNAATTKWRCIAVA